MLSANLSALSVTDILLRLALSFLAGLVLGYERESHGRAAGLRTTLLICVASCLAMLISQMLYADSQVSPNGRSDPARLAAGVLTGMGFVGAGTILREGYKIRGVTTAAVLWFATMLGLAFGAGFILIGIAGFAVGLASLIALPAFEARIENDWYSQIIVTANLEGTTNTAIKNEIESLGVTVQNMDLTYDRARSERVTRCDVKFKRVNKKFGVCETSSKVVEHLFTLPGIIRVEWKR
jgi:putative Mg2+ transporter-C (MgtC) family protein